jgi:hypothetical protein
METMTNQSDLQGSDWMANLKNPQQQALETAQAESLGSNEPAQDVALQQQPV